MPSGYEPLVVDNGSTDGSADIAHDLGARVITESQRGYGAACNAGVEAATDEIVCFMDCDGSLDPRSLLSMVRCLTAEEGDLVLGRRVPDKGSWPPHARLANALLAWHLRRKSHVPIHDVSPIRVVRRDMLHALELTDRRCGWPLEMIVEAARASWRIVEVPVAYHARMGRSKVTGTVRGTVHTVADMWVVVR
jgi:dTDP-L-rhamnose 4-epimerase